MGIESFTPRFTANVPIKKGRYGILHSTEYQFVRQDQENAKLPLLARDVEREALTIYTQFDARVTQRTGFCKPSHLSRKAELLRSRRVHNPTIDPGPTAARRAVELRDTQQFTSGALLLSNVSFQDVDHDVLPRSYDPSVIGLETVTGAYFNRQARARPSIRIRTVSVGSPGGASDQDGFSVGT